VCKSVLLTCASVGASLDELVMRSARLSVDII